MPTFVVEAYAGEVLLEDQRERARQAAERAPDIRYLRTTFLPGDETVLHLFEAPSAEALDRAGRAVALPFERIVEAVENSAPSTPAQQEKEKR
jgi:hypothetical protein